MRRSTRTLSAILAALLIVPAEARSQSHGFLVLDSATVAESGARTLAELLAARVPGANVTWLSGAPGIAPHVSLRGAAGGTGSGRPELIVDGILMRDDRYWIGPSPIEQDLAHHWNLPVREILRVEVVLGPSGGIALEHGAPKGAVLVTTHQPARAAWRGSVSAASRYVEPGPDEPRMFTRTGTLTAGGVTNYCTLAAAAAGDCAPTGTSIPRPASVGSAFSGGVGGQVSADARGAFLGGAARVGVVADRSPGVLGEANERLDLALAFSRSLSSRLRFDASTRLGSSFGDYVNYRDFRARLALAVPPGEPNTFPVQTAREARADAGGETSTRLASRVALALDLGGSDEFRLAVTDERLDRRVTNVTSLPNTGLADRNVLTASADYRRRRGDESEWRQELSVGVRYRDRQQEERHPFGGLNLELSSGNVFATYQLTHRKRRSFSLGVRREWIVDFEDEKALETPLKFASAEWEISAESWMPWKPSAGTLTLFSQYGESTDFEGMLDIIRIPSASASFERSNEHDGGLRWSSEGQAVRASFRWFERDVIDGNIRQPGFGWPSNTDFFNPGVSTRTGGREFALQLNASLGARHRLESSLWTATSTTRFTGPTPVSGINLDGFLNSRVERGARYGTINEFVLEVADTNLDGAVTSDEVSVLRTLWRASVPTSLLGSTFQLRSDLGWRAGFTVDGKFGFYRSSFFEYAQCTLQLCRGLYDVSTSRVEQGRAAIALPAVHKSSFVRLRELWVSKEFRRAGWSGLRVSLIAQNLLTRTRYPGNDPEVTQIFHGGLSLGDRGQQPVAPSLTLRADWGIR